METPHGMEPSGFWEGREGESHLEEKNMAKLSQETPLHQDQALPITLLRIRVAPRSRIQLSPCEIVYR